MSLYGIACPELCSCWTIMTSQYLTDWVHPWSPPTVHECTVKKNAWHLLWSWEWVSRIPRSKAKRWSSQHRPSLCKSQEINFSVGWTNKRSPIVFCLIAQKLCGYVKTLFKLPIMLLWSKLCLCQFLRYESVFSAPYGTSKGFGIKMKLQMECLLYDHLLVIIGNPY